jgi:uncharacterized protein
MRHSTLEDRLVIIFRSDDGKAAMVRLLPGTDLLAGLNAAAAELGFQAATVQVLGAVRTLSVAYFDQETRTYEPHHYRGGLEISGGLGNVSIKDGEPFVHIHLSGWAKEEGRAIAGHLTEGSEVFMIEAYYRVFEGTPPVREFDEEVGLPVWHQR